MKGIFTAFVINLSNIKGKVCCYPCSDFPFSLSIANGDSASTKFFPAKAVPFEKEIYGQVFHNINATVIILYYRSLER